MVYCVLCGYKNDDDARFCVQCGAEMLLPPPDASEEPLHEKQESTSDGGMANNDEEAKKAPKKRGRRKADPGKAVAEPEEKMTFDDHPEEPLTEEVPVVEGLEHEEKKTDSGGEERSTAPEKEWIEPERIDRYIPPAMPPVYPATQEFYRPEFTGSPYTEPVHYGAPQEMRQASPEPESRAYSRSTKPLSTAAYFWLKVLYMIPGLGFIMAIILSAAPVNINLKRFSRATLIFQILAFILILFCVLAMIIIAQRYNYNWRWYNETWVHNSKYHPCWGW